jgi:hypothetical protein
MAIKKKNSERRRVIDLDGPDGNAYALMGYAMNFARQLKYSSQETKAMIEDMKSSDYEHLLEVFDWHFGSFCDLERS